MGLGSMMLGQPTPGHGGSFGMGVDMSILSTIAMPDFEAQRKYEAMGLPDPIAFAALTALGAIPDPMAMLNKMMLKAQERIDREEGRRHPQPGFPAPGSPVPQAPMPPEPNGGVRIPPPEPLAIPPGKSFVEAFKDLQRAQLSQEGKPPERGLLFPVGGYAAAAQRSRGQGEGEADAAEVERLEERLAKQAKEASEQARIAADRVKEAALTATANRDASTLISLEAIRGSQNPTAPKSMAHVFSAGGDDDDAAADRLPPKPGLQTLSSLLTGRQSSGDGGPGALVLPSALVAQKLCIARLPRGTAESAVRLECARHGAVSSVILDSDGTTAYVTFAAANMAATAAQRLTGRAGLFGAAEPLQVRLISELPESVRPAAALLTASAPEAPIDPGELPEYLRPREERKKRRSRSRRRTKSKGRRKRRSRSMVRWLDRSRSNSHTATGQYIRATGCSSTVRWWEKKQESSSTSSSRSRQRRQKAEDEAKRPRQVAVKGNWAQFVQNGLSYYYNVLTGKTVWERPTDFDAVPSRRPWEAAAQQAEEASKAAAPAGPRPTSCFL